MSPQEIIWMRGQEAVLFESLSLIHKVEIDEKNKEAWTWVIETFGESVVRHHPTNDELLLVHRESVWSFLDFAYYFKSEDDAFRFKMYCA